jgi:exonuclease VII small subunit
MTQPPEANELETALLAVYRGPLEGFVSRRDALVKQLRAAKRREDADRVKALRKPSRTAWILDSVVHEDPSVVEQLSRSINAAQTAQSGAEMRATMDNVRAAIREVAAAGSRIAIRADHPIDPSALVLAMHAVIGEMSAFDDLRAGRLVDVPDGGGLDILSAIAINVPASPPVAPASKSTPVPVPEPPNVEAAAEALARAAREAELAIAARAELERAEASLEHASEQSERAERAVRDAQAKLDAAEQALSKARAEAEGRRADVELAQRAADAATAHVRDAERAVAAVRARLPQ